MPSQRFRTMVITHKARPGNVCVLVAFCLTFLVGVAGYVEVVIQYNQKRNFSSIYGSERIAVRAGSVAEGGWRAGKAGILLLDPTASASLNVVGNGTMNVVGAPLIVDSSAADAV